MNYSHLIIGYDSFKDKLAGMMEEGRTLLTINVETDSHFGDFKEKYNSWDDEVGNLLQDSFADRINDFQTEFGQLYSERGYPGNTSSLKDKTAIIKDTLGKKISWMEYNLELIEVCDYIRLGSEFKKTARTKTQEKLNLILDRL